MFACHTLRVVQIQNCNAIKMKRNTKHKSFQNCDNSPFYIDEQLKRSNDNESSQKENSSFFLLFLRRVLVDGYTIIMYFKLTNTCTCQTHVIRVKGTMEQRAGESGYSRNLFVAMHACMRICKNRQLKMLFSL